MRAERMSGRARAAATAFERQMASLLVGLDAVSAAVTPRDAARAAHLAAATACAADLLAWAAVGNDVLWRRVAPAKPDARRSDRLAAAEAARRSAAVVSMLLRGMPDDQFDRPVRVADGGATITVVGLLHRLGLSEALRSGADPG